MSDIAFVIAHYHPKGKVAKHLLNLIHQIKKISSHMVFVSSNISGQSEIEVSHLCDLIKVENIGYDFWSYKNGLDYFSRVKINLRKIIILNSSIIYFQPDKLLHYFNNYNLFQGLNAVTISQEHALHAQSYCISFEGNKFINSPMFNDWWGNLEPISERERVIKEYEIGMSQYFISKGIEIHQLFKATNEQKVIALTRAISTKHFTFTMQDTDNHVALDLNLTRHLNPTHFYWDSLMDQYGFMKIELIKNNSTNQNFYKFLSNMKNGHPNFFELLTDAMD
jgi:rhamnosyltransferase